MKVGLISLGCAKNLVDSEEVLGLLKNSEASICDDYSKCDAIIVNTCGFIEASKKEAIDTILEVSKYKDSNLKHLIVMGCLAQRYKKEIIEEMSEVDRVISISEYGELGNILSETLGVKIPNTYGKNRELSSNPWTAYVRIAEGCNNKCTYCAIPLIRGKYVSRKLEEIVEECKDLANRGVKEIVLIAQDTTMYGIDLYNKLSLSALIKEIDKIEDIKWIRILYMYPDEITDELLVEMKNSKKVLPYFDIPVQYGNDRILKLMNRRGSVASIKEIVNKIRNMFIDPILRTTIIVGFPGEDDEAFLDTLNFVKEIRWDRLGTFTYSKEEDTKAFEMDNEVDEKTMIYRYNKIMEEQQIISNEINQSYINKVLEVLIESYDAKNNIYRGRGKGFAPDDVDGSIIVRSSEKLNIGDFYDINIVDATSYDLIGERR